ncbi:MAG: hypothetical protein LJE91_03010 [Gammaproteobacteria bacterium]|nr:hypothetical protein [Gammaproteobacteria bacterium]
MKQGGRQLKANYPMLVLALLVLAFSTACAHVEEREQVNAFKKDVLDYGRMLRWRNYEDATRFLRKRDHTRVESHPEDLKELRITAYDLVRTTFTPEGDEAEIVARIEYYYDGSNVVKEIEDTQDWWYEKEEKRWYLDGNLPEFE